MNEENKLDKIQSLNEISKVYDLNKLITDFSVINEFIKQSIMYISIKKNKNETLSEQDRHLFKDKFEDMKSVIEKIISFE